ncbi:cation diffusion facilitator family transporter [Mangrovivirga sp. M17]|uniref:Cation diffusion facilitator family transporter n=1 Tax=Mangrovivirga halotolerans TaxID=2993936 RepID=A0ABT3RRF5_9BACT|nr:cation diffusion facilitator family transporter [Mangrovivirga halotolerans]MCX2744181.1 cation diffusion facilitator family transporter [Mangrovivirga halotolerans]
MGHGHGHSHTPKSFGKAFAIGIVLNTVYVGVEAFYGLTVNSSALLADAGHNASDVFSLILAWAAIWVSDKKPSGKYTFGLRKTTILASMFNGLLIIGAAGFILYDAIQKFKSPVEIPGDTLMIVAGIGLIVNSGTALLFMKGRDDLNIKGAFLHMAADAAVTLGVLIGGLVMKHTGAYWVDPTLSIIIVVVIFYGAWELLSDSIKLAVDAVPGNINIEEVHKMLSELDHVEEVHDLHIWAMSTTETALTAHLVIPDGCNDEYIFEIRNKLKDEFGIDHTTIQIENTFADDEYREKI